MREEAVLQDALGLELVAAVNDDHLTGEICQEQRFLDSGVAAAHDDDALVAIEEAIACGAGRNAEAPEGLLGWQVQPFGLRTRADDQRITGVLIARVALEPDRLVVETHFGDGIGHDIGAHMCRLSLHLFH